MPIICAGLGVALPRRVAQLRVSNNNSASVSCFLQASGAVFIFASVFVALINIFSSIAAFFILGDPQYEYLVAPLSSCIFGLSISAICYSFLRGLSFFGFASIYQIIAYALIPMVAFFVCSGKVVLLFWWIGLLSTFISMMLIYYVFSKHKVDFNLSDIKGLLSYGVRRVPGDFAIGMLFALPSMVAVHLVDLRNAGIIAFGVSIINMSATALSPFSTLLLPYSAKLIKLNKVDILKKHVKFVLFFSFFFSLTAILLGEIFAEIGIKYWIGAEYLPQSKIIRFLIVGIAPYSLYISLRSVLDAAFFKAMNARNAYIAIIVFFLFFILFKQVIVVSFLPVFSFIVSLFALAFLTSYQLFSYFSEKTCRNKKDF